MSKLDETIDRVHLNGIRGYTKIGLRKQIRALVKECIPETKPKVIKCKGYYPPYQPQVESHKRQGYNEAISEITKTLKEKGLL
jgi:hypothetical protein